MNLFDALPTITRIAGPTGVQSVQITFTPALTPELRTQIATQPLTLTVSGTTGNQLTFTTPTGTSFTAMVSPPLPLGTQLQLSVADLLPAAPNLPASPLPLIQARIIPPATPGNIQPGTVAASSTSAPQVPQPVTPSPIPASAPNSLVLSPSAGNTATLQNVITTTLLQQIVAAAIPSGNTQLPVPAGPVAATLPAALSTNLLNQLLSQPLTLTPTSPLQTNGTQPATLTPQPTAATPNPAPVTITLNLGVSLPVGKPQPAMLLPATPQSNMPQPVLILTGTSALPPAPPQPGLQIVIANQPQQQATVGTSPTEPLTEPTIPTAARILPPQPGQAAGTQTALLATGTTIIIKSPQPLPTGSIIVADLPITPNAGIQRVFTADAQSQPQPNTAQQTQTAAPVPTQTTQAVLSAGQVIHGTITGQNEQGQPLLTITEPGTLSGQTVPLTLTGNTALLPIGAQVNLRVENNLAVTILTLTLPPQTQAAYTVGTIGARWEGLQQALSVLQQQAPVQAANLRASLPQLSNLLPGLIAFTNALRRNDPDDVFDAEATRLLKSMGIDLSADVAQLSQLQQRHAPSADPQWRGTLFPYVEATGEDPRQGGFFWRREKSDDPRSSTNTRFVVEVEMSQMGAVQLDGLVTYPEIWLKLRRTSAPEEGFTEGLQSLVNNLLQTSGLSGGIAVETTQTFPVNPRAELLAQTENPLPTTA